MQDANDALQEALLKMDTDKKKRYEDANARLTQSIKINQLVESDGWKEIVLPMIEASIIKNIGGKKEGKWEKGLVIKGENDRKGRSSEFFAGAGTAMIEIVDKINSLAMDVDSLSKTITGLLDNNEKVIEKHPLLDGSYRRV